jgi:hypothetical protein
MFAQKIMRIEVLTVNCTLAAMTSNVSSRRFFRAENHTFSGRKSRFFGPKVTFFRAESHVFSGRKSRFFGPKITLFRAETFRVALRAPPTGQLSSSRSPSILSDAVQEPGKVNLLPDRVLVINIQYGLCFVRQVRIRYIFDFHRSLPLVPYIIRFCIKARATRRNMLFL